MIKVYQCKEPCCMVQPPAKRFWKAEYCGVLLFTATTRMGAFTQAAEYVMSLPQEVTA